MKRRYWAMLALAVVTMLAVLTIGDAIRPARAQGGCGGTFDGGRGECSFQCVDGQTLNVGGTDESPGGAGPTDLTVTALCEGIYTAGCRDAHEDADSSCAAVNYDPFGGAGRCIAYGLAHVTFDCTTP
jgi:hypothetical protein